MDKDYVRCSVCTEKCKTNCINCEICQQCDYYQCENAWQRKVWCSRLLDQDYFCIICRPTEQGSNESSDEGPGEGSKDGLDEGADESSSNAMEQESQDKPFNYLNDLFRVMREIKECHPSVKGVEYTRDVPFLLISLYNDQQIQDIKRFCCVENGSVLGIDKTYNVGKFKVTPTVYKDLSVVESATGEHPLCLGPALIHKSSTTKSYSSLFLNIASELTDLETDSDDNFSDLDAISRLTIGSDEKQSIKNALEGRFRRCTHVLCKSQLKENASKYMRDVVGMPLKAREDILAGIFGSDGIVENTEVDTYYTRLTNLRGLIDENDRTNSKKTFSKYFEKKLRPLLEEHVIEPVRQGKIPSTWRNESAKNIMKSATRRKPDLTEFIHRLSDIVLREQEERCKAVSGMGNFHLSERYTHNLVDHDRWSALQPDERDEKINKFLADYGQPITVSVASTGRKPHQTK